MGPAARSTTAERKRNPASINDLVDDCFGVASRKSIVTIASPAQHDRTLPACSQDPVYSSPDPELLVANWCGGWKVAVHVPE